MGNQNRSTEVEDEKKSSVGRGGLSSKHKTPTPSHTWSMIVCSRPDCSHAERTSSVWCATDNSRIAELSTHAYHVRGSLADEGAVACICTSVVSDAWSKRVATKQQEEE